MLPVFKHLSWSGLVRCGLIILAHNSRITSSFGEELNGGLQTIDLRLTSGVVSGRSGSRYSIFHKFRPVAKYQPDPLRLAVTRHRPFTKAVVLCDTPIRLLSFDGKTQTVY